MSEHDRQVQDMTPAEVHEEVLRWRAECAHRVAHPEGTPGNPAFNAAMLRLFDLGLDMCGYDVPPQEGEK